MSIRLPGLLILLTPFAANGWGQLPQNPSPMVETTRQHGRLKEAAPNGARLELDLGTLFIPDSLAKRDGPIPLIIHFHGGKWLPEVAAATEPMRSVLAINLGAGSGRYAKPFREEPERFALMLQEAERLAERKLSPLVLSSWSAGYGAIREVLGEESNYARVDGVLLLDGLHAGYVNDKPGPQKSELASESLDVFVRLARDAVAGRKCFVVTHSTVFPGTYASTTETADYLLEQLELPRQAVLRWGPQGMQQLSEATRGRFTVLGFAGNSAPDHVDHLHAMPSFWQLVDPR